MATPRNTGEVAQGEHLSSSPPPPPTTSSPLTSPAPRSPFAPSRTLPRSPQSLASGGAPGGASGAQERENPSTEPAVVRGNPSVLLVSSSVQDSGAVTVPPAHSPSHPPASSSAPMSHPAPPPATVVNDGSGAGPGIVRFGEGSGGLGAIGGIVSRQVTLGPVSAPQAPIVGNPSCPVPVPLPSIPPEAPASSLPLALSPSSPTARTLHRSRPSGNSGDQDGFGLISGGQVGGGPSVVAVVARRRGSVSGDATGAGPTGPQRGVESVPRLAPPMTRSRNPLAAPLRPPPSTMDDIDVTPFLGELVSGIDSDGSSSASDSAKGKRARGRPSGVTHVGRGRPRVLARPVEVSVAPPAPAPSVPLTTLAPSMGVIAPSVSPVGEFQSGGRNDPPRRLDPARVTSRASLQRGRARVQFQDQEVLPASLPPASAGAALLRVACPLPACPFLCSFGDPDQLGRHLEEHVSVALSGGDQGLTDECIRLLTILRSSGGQDCSPFPPVAALPEGLPTTLAPPGPFPPVSAELGRDRVVQYDEFVSSLRALLATPSLGAWVDPMPIMDAFLRGRAASDPLGGVVAAARRDIACLPPSGRAARLSALLVSLPHFELQERGGAFPPPGAPSPGLGQGQARLGPHATHLSSLPPSFPLVHPLSGAGGGVPTPRFSPPPFAQHTPAPSFPSGSWEHHHPSLHGGGGAGVAGIPSPGMYAGVPAQAAPVGHALGGYGGMVSLPAPHVGQGGGYPPSQLGYAAALHPPAFHPTHAPSYPVWGTTVGGSWSAEGPEAAGALLSRWLAVCGRVELVRLPDQSTVTESVRLGESIAPFRAAKRGFEGSNYAFLLSAALTNAPLTCFDSSLVARWKAGVSVVTPKDVAGAERLALLEVPHLSAFAPPSGSASLAIADSGELFRALQALRRAVQHLFGIGNPIDPDMARLVRLVDVDWRADGISPNQIALIVEHGWSRWRRAAHDFCMPRLDVSSARVLLCPGGRLDPAFPSLYEYVCQSRFQVAAGRKAASLAGAGRAATPGATPGSLMQQAAGRQQPGKASTKHASSSDAGETTDALRRALGAAGRIKINGKPLCVKFLRGLCTDDKCPRSHGE